MADCVAPSLGKHTLVLSLSLEIFFRIKFKEIQSALGIHGGSVPGNLADAKTRR